MRGRLRVEVDPFFARLVLAPHLDTFLCRHPELQLEVVTTDGPRDLVAGGFDLAIRFGDTAAVGLIKRKLLDTRILTVASPGYLRANGRPGHPSELSGHACIHYRDSQTGRPFEWEFRRGATTLPVAVTGRLTVTDVGTMLGACLAGAGIAQIMAIGCAHLLARGELEELFPDWPDETFPLNAYHPSRHQQPPKVSTFIEFCLEVTSAAENKPL